MKMYFKILAAKIILVTSFAQAQWLVLDPANFEANLMDWTTNLESTIENIAQTAKQIEEYKTQLDQYETQLKNLKNVPQQLWDDVNGTINKLSSAMNTMESYKQKFGSLNGILEQFKSDYTNHSCFKIGSTCSDSEKSLLKSQEKKVAEYQKSVNDDLLKGIEKQIDQISADGKKLSQLQSQSEGAEGNLQALQYANQFAANTNHQLLQIRQMATQQMQSEAAKREDEIDLAAKEKAANEKIRQTNYKESPKEKFGIKTN